MVIHRSLAHSADDVAQKTVTVPGDYHWAGPNSCSESQSSLNLLNEVLTLFAIPVKEGL